MAVSKRLRFEVMRRDNHTCRYCGRSAPEVKLAVDHVIPEALGGRDEPANLATACVDCNSGKTSIAPDSPLVTSVAEDALRWAQAVKVAANQMLAEQDARQEVYNEFLARWNEWGHQPLPPNWEGSVASFLAAGLPKSVLLKCVDIAMSNLKVHPDRVFRYLCGVAWARVREIHESARAIVDGGPSRMAPDIVTLTEDQSGCSACNGTGDLAATILSLFPYDESEAAFERAQSRIDRVRIYEDDAAEAARLAVLELLMERGRQLQAVTY
jgi:hypothetical protein